MDDYDYNSELSRQNRSRPVLKEGEWACVDAKCAYINGERSQTCHKCGKTKPRAKTRVGKEIGKEAAEKSKGLFSAEDWVCSKCGNVNWARRNMCNICNAPKLADLEVRTGYGGGYMDRQDVEYVTRDDYDEEFDEFGRKKRRKKHDSEKAPINVDQAETEQSKSEMGNATDEKWDVDLIDEDENRLHKGTEEELEDEELEEDDDGDLDKYDLTADTELATFKVNLELLRKNLEMNGKTDNEGINYGQTNNGKRRGSHSSSDCSCSCSGGECSCRESEDEIASKKPKREEKNEKRDFDSKKSDEKDSNDGRKPDDKHRATHRTERDEKEKSRDRRGVNERERSKERHRDRDRERRHERSRERERRQSRDRDR